MFINVRISIITGNGNTLKFWKKPRAEEKETLIGIVFENTDIITKFCTF